MVDEQDKESLKENIIDQGSDVQKLKLSVNHVNK